MMVIKFGFAGEKFELYAESRVLSCSASGPTLSVQYEGKEVKFINEAPGIWEADMGRPVLASRFTVAGHPVTVEPGPLY